MSRRLPSNRRVSKKTPVTSPKPVYVLSHGARTLVPNRLSSQQWYKACNFTANATTTYNLRLAHNTTVFSGGDAGGLYTCTSQNSHSNSIVENNIILVRSASAGISGLTFSRYNLLYGGDNPNVPNLSGDELHVDPQFVNTNPIDFRLQAGSPAVGAGVNKDAQYFHTTRGGATDLGAIEHGDNWLMPRPGPAWATGGNTPWRPVVPASLDPSWLGLAITSQPPATPIFVDTGGASSYTDSEGQVWSADKGFTGGQTIDRGAIAIEGTSDPRIYQTERYGMSGYAFSVPDGSYTVRLRFAETYSGITAAGQRVFSVNVEGTQIIDMDVFAEAGGRNRALIKTVTAKVSDGQLNITFTPTTQSAIISGIEIVESNATTLGATADAYVRSGSFANDNYGAATTLDVKLSTDPNNIYNRDGYVKFDLTNTNTISNARLRIYAALSATGAALTSGAHAAPDVSWIETGTNSITWNNRPAYDATPLGIVIIANSANYAWYEIDVTAYAQAEKSAGRNLISFALHAPVVTTPLIQISSKEGANGPQLVVTP